MLESKSICTDVIYFEVITSILYLTNFKQNKLIILCLLKKLCSFKIKIFNN